MKALVSNGSSLRITPPENRHQRLGLAVGVRARVQRTNRGLGDFLPAFALMRIRPPDADSQTSVEQHHPTFRPRCQIAVGGHGHPKVVNQFLINIDQAFRQRVNIWRHAEAQTHRVTRGRVGVLADNQHLDGIERDGERAQNIVACRQPRAPGGVFRTKKIAHMVDGGLHVGQGMGPPWLYQFAQWFDHDSPL